MTKILVADNDSLSLDLVQRLLRDRGYDVVRASNPLEAFASFDSHRLDAAVIDYKLRDDSESDRSGLEVAIKSDPRVPKIIISNKAQRDEVMAAVQTSPEGLALAVAFLAKDDLGIDKPHLYEAVQRALKTGKLWARQAREGISPELQRDFKQASRFASWQLILHLLANVAFVVIMVWAAIGLHAGILSMLFLMIGTVAAEITNLLLATRGKEVSLIARADRYHGELLATARFEQLLAACDSLGTPVEIRKARLEVIRSVTSKWFGIHSARSAHQIDGQKVMPLLAPSGADAEEH